MPLQKSPLQTIGEEQTQNPYTELLVLKAYHDIVQFLAWLDDYIFASAGDDGLSCSEYPDRRKTLELKGHTQKITAIITFPSLEVCEEKNQLILTASADRTVIVSFSLEESKVAIVTQGTSIYTLLVFRLLGPVCTFLF